MSSGFTVSQSSHLGYTPIAMSQSQTRVKLNRLKSLSNLPSAPKNQARIPLKECSRNSRKPVNSAVERWRKHNLISNLSRSAWASQANPNNIYDVSIPVIGSFTWGPARPLNRLDRQPSRSTPFRALRRLQAIARHGIGQLANPLEL